MANKDACNDLPSFTSTQKSDLTIKLDSQTEISAGLKCTQAEVERLAFVASNSAASAKGSTDMHRRSELLTRKYVLWFAVVATTVVLGSSLVLLSIYWMKSPEVSVFGDDNSAYESRTHGYASAGMLTAKLERRDGSDAQGGGGSLMDALIGEF